VSGLVVHAWFETGQVAPCGATLRPPDEEGFAGDRFSADPARVTCEPCRPFVPGQRELPGMTA